MGNKVNEGQSMESIIPKDPEIDVNLSPKDFVKAKIQESSYYNKKFADNIDEISDYLSDKKKLLDSYLSLDWLVTQRLEERIAQMFETYKDKETEGEEEEEEEDKNKKLMFSPPPSNSDDEPLELFATPEDISQVRSMPDFQLEHHIKIKFMVVEILRLKKRPLTKFLYFNVITPYLAMTKALPEFGVYHIALQIGPFIIELNSSGLCIPRKLSSRAALISTDLRAISTKDNVVDTIDKVAEVIVRWNTKVQYSKNKGKPKNKDGRQTGNCQQFLLEVLEDLGIDMDQVIKGPMKRYIKRIINDGWAGMEFITDDKFKKKFGMKQKKKVFTSHEELDKFTIDLIKKDSVFQYNHPEEYAMLKAFDRALWLKHLRLPECKIFQPAKTVVEDEDGFDEVLDCPFKDPRDTKSFFFPKMKDYEKKEKKEEFVMIEKKDFEKKDEDESEEEEEIEIVVEEKKDKKDKKDKKKKKKKK